MGTKTNELKALNASEPLKPAGDHMRRKTGIVKVSVAIYTTEGKGVKHLSEAIDSCFAQTHENIEIIVVDDASGERAGRILKKYRKNTIKTVRFKKHMGLGEGLNRAFAGAEGDFYFWINDTVELYPEAVKEMLRIFDADPRIDIVYADYEMLPPDSDKKHVRRLGSFLQFNKFNKMGPCFLFRAETFKSLDGFRPEYTEVADHDFWIRAANRFRLKRCPRVLALLNDVPYYGRRIDRTYSPLVRSLIRYRHGFVDAENFKKSAVSFKHRIRMRSSGYVQYAWRLSAAMAKFFRFSKMEGNLFLSAIFSENASGSGRIINTMGNRIASDVEIYFAGRKLKPCHTGINVLCVAAEAVIGGAEQGIMSIARSTKHHGFNFHLLTARKYAHRWIDGYLDVFDNVILLRKGFRHWSCRYNAEYYRYLKCMIKRLRIRILLISNAIAPYGALLKLKEEFPELKVVDILHTAINFGAVHDNILPFVPLIDRRICISYSLKEYMRKKYERFGIGGDYVERLNVIHNGHDMTRFQIDDAAKGRFIDICNSNRLFVKNVG